VEFKPAAQLEINIPASSVAGRKLRVKGRGLTGKTPRDFYFALKIMHPSQIATPTKMPMQICKARSAPSTHARRLRHLRNPSQLTDNVLRRTI
jgi:DnaJ-class molecular chaperone